MPRLSWDRADDSEFRWRKEGREVIWSKGSSRLKAAKSSYVFTSFELKELPTSTGQLLGGAKEPESVKMNLQYKFRQSTNIFLEVNYVSNFEINESPGYL